MKLLRILLLLLAYGYGFCQQPEHKTLFLEGETYTAVKSIYDGIRFEKKQKYDEVLIDSCVFTGSSSIGNYSFGIKKLEIYDSKIDTLFVHRMQVHNFWNDTIRKIEFKNCLFGEDSIKNSRFEESSFEMAWGIIDNAIFESCTFGDYTINGMEFKKSLEFIGCSFDDNSGLEAIGIPDTLIFLGTDLSKMKQNLDFEYPIDSTKKICNISFYNTDIDKIDIRYENFHLFFLDFLRLTFEEKVVTYQSLLNKFKSKGQFQSYEKLDKEFREFKYTNSYYSNKNKWYYWIYSYGFVLNWFDWIWWDYGYNKFQVVLCSIALCFIFFILNLKSFPTMIKDGYKLERFHKINEGIDNAYFDDEKKKFRKKIPYVFLYTCYIFWGWKLDLNIMNVKKKRLFAYILLQYLVGIICLAYIANFILTVRTVNI